jgi:hypothetical protein
MDMSDRYRLRVLLPKRQQIFYQNELFAKYNFVTMFFPSQINGEINLDDIFIEENTDKLRKSDKDGEDKVYYHISAQVRKQWE